MNQPPTQNSGALVSSPTMDWLLEGCTDADTIRTAWASDPRSCQPITTGRGFDAVILPELLGNAAHGRLSAQGLYPPTALIGEDVVMLVRAGSSWHGPGVPAALDLRAGRSRVWLPHPEDCAWITTPNAGRLPGFIPLLTAVRDLLWRDYYRRCENLLA